MNRLARPKGCLSSSADQETARYELRSSSCKNRYGDLREHRGRCSRKFFSDNTVTSFISGRETCTFTVVFSNYLICLIVIMLDCISSFS